MTDVPSVLLVTDTSVLLNFLRIDRMDLIGNVSIQFIVTDHAAEEILELYPEQIKCFERAVAAGHCGVCCVEDEGAMELFARLTATTRLGIGESATIAHALAIGAGLAIDDRRAANEARRIDGGLIILGTAEIMLRMIREGLLSVEEADAILEDWATNHRFKLKFRSFSEFL